MDNVLDGNTQKLNLRGITVESSEQQTLKRKRELEPGRKELSQHFETLCATEHLNEQSVQAFLQSVVKLTGYRYVEYEAVTTRALKAIREMASSQTMAQKFLTVGVEGMDLGVNILLTRLPEEKNAVVEKIRTKGYYDVAVKYFDPKLKREVELGAFD